MHSIEKALLNDLVVGKELKKKLALQRLCVCTGLEGSASKLSRKMSLSRSLFQASFSLSLCISNITLLLSQTPPSLSGNFLSPMYLLSNIFLVYLFHSLTSLSFSSNIIFHLLSLSLSLSSVLNMCFVWLTTSASKSMTHSLSLSYTPASLK